MSKSLVLNDSFIPNLSITSLQHLYLHVQDGSFEACRFYIENREEIEKFHSSLKGKSINETLQSEMSFFSIKKNRQLL